MSEDEDDIDWAGIAGMTISAFVIIGGFGYCFYDLWKSRNRVEVTPAAVQVTPSAGLSSAEG